MNDTGPRPDPPSCDISEAVTPPRLVAESLVLALIDPRPLIRAALAYGLRMRPDTSFVLFDTAAAFMQFAPERPDLSLVIVSAGAHLPGGDGRAVVRELVGALPRLRVIVIGDAHEASHMEATIREGARAYIPTSLDLPVARAALGVVLA